MIVDDNKTWHEILKNILTIFGLKVDSAFSGQEAIDKMFECKNNYDAVLMDWNMPNMNGLQLVQKVRSEGNHTKTPIIMITTEGGKAEVITALKAGVNNYIVKPFTPQVLKEKFEQMNIKL